MFYVFQEDIFITVYDFIPIFLPEQWQPVSHHPNWLVTVKGYNWKNLRKKKIRILLFFTI